MSTHALKFLADESLESRIVLFLRDKGYDILAISEVTPSIKDTEVLKIARNENRVIITNDKDFGDLVFFNHLKHTGIILCRFKTERIQYKIDAITKLLKYHKNKLVGNFVVVDETEVRIRT